MFHDNSSTARNSKFRTVEESKPGFTHIYTPNDFEPDDEEILDAFSNSDFDIISVSDV